MSTRSDKKQKRKDQAHKRLDSLKHLRKINAPAWVIKSTQIALVLNRAGLRHAGIGKAGNKCQDALYLKYVVPLMEGNSNDIL